MTAIQWLTERNKANHKWVAVNRARPSYKDIAEIVLVDSYPEEPSTAHLRLKFTRTYIEYDQLEEFRDWLDRLISHTPRVEDGIYILLKDGVNIAVANSIEELCDTYCAAGIYKDYNAVGRRVCTWLDNSDKFIIEKWS